MTSKQQPVGFHIHKGKPSIVFHSSTDRGKDRGTENEFETIALTDSANFKIGEKHKGSIVVGRHPSIKGPCIITRLTKTPGYHYFPVDGPLKKGMTLECEKIYTPDGEEYKFQKKTTPRHFKVMNFPKELNNRILELLG